MAELEKRLRDSGEWSYNEFHDKEWIPAPCQKTCPVGTDVASYVGLIWEGKLKEAVEVITATNPFSAVCGWVCSKPCETDCRRGESDAPVAIRALKRFAMEQAGRDFRFPPVQVTKKQTVGIVGAGPTGLTAAQDLAVAGYEVHLYERADRLGGMMNAIPEFRLPRPVIQADLDRLLDRCPGIHVHLNAALGKDIELEELKKRHDAVLITIGLWRDRKLGIPGEEEGKAGIYGIGLLTELSSGKKIELPEKVVVVGGGNVAMDMSRTALRLGAKQVELFCLESREEMPAWKHEIEEAEEEGIVMNPSWGPKEIKVRDGQVTAVEFMRCVSVFDAERRFRPVYDQGTTRTVDADAVLLSIGLMTDNPALENIGLVERGFVRAEFATMRTKDPKVFAAGDCAFGPSAVVYAMGQGHRAAYYVEAFLDGREDPLPYKVPYRTRGVEIAQDPNWETLPREDPPFHGFRPEDPFAECEATYDPETAHRQAARCLRCDAETGTADYSRRTREHIHAMARMDTQDIERVRALALERMKPRDNPYPPERPAHIDDLVFLSAALTRLVIDPYREHCDTTTRIGGSLVLDQPILLTGFDEAPEEVQHAVAESLKQARCGYVGLRPLPQKRDAGEGCCPWLQLVVPGKSEPRADADALVYVQGKSFEPVKAERLKEGQLLGLSVSAPALEEAIPWALDQGFDLLVLDGTSGIEKPWVELEGYPDLTVMRDAIRILRHKLNREEDIALLYFGGLRSGSDLAKVLAINCLGGLFNVAPAIGLGGAMEGDRMAFDSSLNIEERTTAAGMWIKAIAEEAAIIARCTGKTFVHNLEPEDMRSITLATSDAMDIPMASGTRIREGF